jgi:hypothetical protein
MKPGRTQMRQVCTVSRSSLAKKAPNPLIGRLP